MKEWGKFSSRRFKGEIMELDGKINAQQETESYFFLFSFALFALELKPTNNTYNGLGRSFHLITIFNRYTKNLHSNQNQSRLQF